MNERRTPVELSSDPGELVRIYDEYVESLVRRLIVIVYGTVPDPLP